MNDDELRRNLEFEYWGYYEAKKSEAEWHNIPFLPMTMEEFFCRRGVVKDEEEQWTNHPKASASG